METALISLSLLFGLWAGWRMVSRAARAVWARLVSSVWWEAACAWVASWGAVPPDDTSISIDMYQAPEAAPQINLTDREGVLWLARKKTVDGKWAMSANAIYDVVKGNRNEVLGWIREARAEEAQPATVTPYAGRPYDPKQYHDDPSLAYEAPPSA
jgi:hypothetical protein